MTTATHSHRSPIIRSDYLDPCLDPNDRRKLISCTVQTLLPHRLEFDTIAFRGMSGALIAPEIAQYLQKPLLLVRKGENKHSCFEVEGNIHTERYLIVDDFISSGNTIKEIRLKIEEAQRNLGISPQGICWGIALYKKTRDEDTEKYYRGLTGIERIFLTSPPAWYSLP